MRVGAASVDVTPPAGLRLSGFAARTAPATGAHDRLSVRAVVVEGTALVVCDVLGLSAETTARVRERCALASDAVVVAAQHTHGAPEAMPGRVGVDCSPAFLASIEDGCVAAIEAAARRRRPCRLERALGSPPGIAVNRRHAGGVVDDTLTVLRFVGTDDGRPVATLVGYACHPVVLGADNRRYTADYPHAVRETIERDAPGSVALFVTGAAGEANSGHSAADSVSLDGSPRRTFAEAARIGEHIGRCALAAPFERSVSDVVDVADEHVPLALSRRESVPLDAHVARWRARLADADAPERALLGHWIDWAENVALADDVVAPVPGPVCRVTLLRWGDATLAALPGETFAATARAVRERLGDPQAFIVGYADDNPGYLPPAEEYPHGGYEIDEAHRYYRQPATFAEDSVARLLASVGRLGDRTDPRRR